MSSEIDSPAKLHTGHSRSRLLGAYAGAPKGWVNDEESVLDRYAKGGQLAVQSEAHRDITGEMRVRAGHAYRGLCERSRGSGRDSSQLTISGARSPGTISDDSADAKTKLKTIDGRLSENDRKLVRMVCDEGYWPSQAVRSIGTGYEKSVGPRFREAMDALVLAFETAKRSGHEVRIG